MIVARKGVIVARRSVIVARRSVQLFFWLERRIKQLSLGYFMLRKIHDLERTSSVILARSSVIVARNGVIL